MLTNFFGAAGAFIKQPFQQNMGLGNWALLTVFVVTIALLWVHVLRYITEEV